MPREMSFGKLSGRIEYACVLQWKLLGVFQSGFRIAARRHGLKEKDRLRLIQAFLISRITHALHILALRKRKLGKWIA